MGSMSMIHWVIVLAVFAMIFGTSKLAGIGKDLGSAVKNFKSGIAEVEAKPEEKPKA